MKKLLITLALVSVAFSSASAQDEWEFGVKGGIALNMMPHTTLDAGDQYKANFGFQGGAYACMYLSDSILGQVELQYSRKGVTTINHTGEYVVGGSALEYTRNISYLQIPVLFGFYSIMDDKIRLLLGPELGIFLGDQIKSNYLSPSYVANECNPLNLALGLQATYFVTDSFGIELKFDFGLTHTFKPLNSEKLADDKGRNSSVQLNLVYRFGY